MDNGMNKINREVENQQTKVIGLIDIVLEELSLEIEARKTISGNEIPSVLQLESISNELIKMKNVLSPKNYYPTYTRQIVDSWEINSKFGDKLLSVEQEYTKLN
ncbi:hypothetical protein WAX74_03030 [Psychrobacillus sp. FJAT-51614]|uniref:Uncharacterized protein n=1 Tax=Psychrobacillus mangrovi TaxID=3117745 RepID=A0ABU8F0W8_9BACI